MRKTDMDPLADVRSFLGSEYLNAKDVEDGVLTFAVASVSKEEFEAKKGEKKQKPRLVLTCEGDPVRKLSCNATNLQTFIDGWGTDARLWNGGVFDAVYDKTVRDPSGKQTGGLRVRLRALPPAVAQLKTNGSGTTETHDASVPF